MTKLLLPLFCVTASLALHGSLAAQGELTLRVAAKKGASVWLLQEQKQEQSVDQGGQQMEMGNTTTHTLHVTVRDVDDKGVMTVETEIVRIHGSMQMGPMGEAEFDSATPADGDDEDGNPFSPQAMTKSLVKAAGKKFIAKVDSHGKALAIEGAEDLVKNGGGRMGGGMTEGSLKQMAESAFGMMPDQPIAVGGTWDYVEKEGARIPAEHKLKLTLAKADDASFEVTATGTIEKAAQKDEGGKEDDPTAAMMKNMTIQNGKITGMQRVSRQDGFIIDSTNTTSMDIEVESPMGAASVGVKTVTTVKRTTAEAAMPKKAEKDKAEPAKEEKKEGGK